MKKLISVIIFLTFIVLTSFSQNKSFDDFRGLKWGDSMIADNMVKINNSYIELSLQKEENNKSYYTLENEDLTIGTAELDMIYYVFDDGGEFCGLDIEGQPESKDDIIYILENKFGDSPIYIKNNEVRYRQWKTKNGVNIKLYENENDDYILQVRDKSMDDFYEVNNDVDDF